MDLKRWGRVIRKQEVSRFKVGQGNQEAGSNAMACMILTFCDRGRTSSLPSVVAVCHRLATILPHMATKAFSPTSHSNRTLGNKPSNHRGAPFLVLARRSNF